MLYSASAGIPFLGKATDDMLLMTDVLNPYLLILNLEIAFSVMACNMVGFPGYMSYTTKVLVS